MVPRTALTVSVKGRIIDALRWTTILSACSVLATVAEALAFPAPHLLVGLLAGAALALSGAVKHRMPEDLTRSSHALVGALMGSYLNMQTLAGVASTAFPLALITLLTIGISLGTAYVLSRITTITVPDSVLSMVPGGSAAIVACASDAGADARLVAFAQYIRVGLVALTAPFILLALNGALAGNTGLVALRFPVHGHLIAASNQVSGLVVLVAICVLGSSLGRRLSLPAPILLGSMLIAAVAVATQAVSGFTPTGPLRDVVFVAVGLEVGLRFTWPSVRHVGRQLPHIVGATLLVCVACAGLAWLFAGIMQMPFLEAYLATTPGGINAVLATADSAHTDVSVVSTVQSLRLFVVCLFMPPLVRWLTTRRSRASVPSRVVPPAVNARS